MTLYTLEGLRAINGRFDHNHRITQEDVEIVNEAIGIMEQNISEVPQIGDMVEFTNEYGDYFATAHIEKVAEKLNICERPYEPFMVIDRVGKRFSTMTSGGAWTNIPKQLTFVGVKDKVFVISGHAGVCANGAVRFVAPVKVWEYTEGEHQFTTKTHDKFHVTILNKPANPLSEYRYFVNKQGERIHAFRKEEEYEAWLKTFGGIQMDGLWGNNKMVWTLKQIEKCVPLEEYLRLENTITDSELENATIQECKRLYEGTTVTTFLPHQHQRIELEGMRLYMRAYDF